MSAVDSEAPLFVETIVVLADCKYKPTSVGTAVTCLLSRLIAAFWRSASALRLALLHVSPPKEHPVDWSATHSQYI